MVKPGKRPKNKKRGPDPETLDLEGPWEDRLKEALARTRPKEGWPSMSDDDLKERLLAYAESQIPEASVRVEPEGSYDGDVAAMVLRFEFPELRYRYLAFTSEALRNPDDFAGIQRHMEALAWADRVRSEDTASKQLLVGEGSWLPKQYLTF